MENTEIKKVEQTSSEQQESLQKPNQEQIHPVIPENLTHSQALQVLIDAAKIAQSKGVFTLDDAELINHAIRTFVPKGPVSINS